MASNPIQNLSARTLTGGLGLTALFAQSGYSRAASQNNRPRTEGLADGVDSPNRTPQELDYAALRAFHRSYLGDTDRSDIPNMMQTFRRPPRSTEEDKFLDWRAERDALIDRALALGYVIGELRAVRSGTRSWSAIGFGTICGAPFVYPIGGDYWQAPAPKNGSATLMNRRWAMLGVDDLEPRPYIAAIPHWFLLEPTQG